MFQTLFVILIYVGLPGGVVYLILRGIRAFERRGSSPEQIAALSGQLSELRELHWTMRTSLDRLREEKEFADKLLEAPIRSVPSDPPSGAA